MITHRPSSEVIDVLIPLSESVSVLRITKPVSTKDYDLLKAAIELYQPSLTHVSEAADGNENTRR